MSLARPVAFPLLPIVWSNGVASCACGNPKCSRVGKHAAVEWGSVEYGSEVPLPEEGAGLGLRTGAHPKGSDIIVVDLDGAEAVERFHALGGFDGETYTVRTGREDGYQLYFRHPGFPVRSSVSKLAPQIDIRGDGGIVVAAGSPHKSGRRYELVVDCEPAEAPAWLLEWLKTSSAPSIETKTYPGDVSDEDERAHRRSLYTAFLKTAPPCVQGRGGDSQLFEVVQRGAYDLQLPTEDVLELVAEHYDPRCVPPWGDELASRVTHKSHSAKTTSTRPRNEPLPRDVAALVLDMPPIPAGGLKDLPTPAKRKRATGFTFGEWDEDIPPPKYLVQGLIPIETVGMFVALGSSVKTWTALSIALAVATGRPWLDRFPVKEGRVAIADWESGAYELKRRVQFLERGGKKPITNLGAMSYSDLRIDDEAFWHLLAKEDLELVIVDSLAAGAPGVDENVAEIALPLKMAARFSEATGASVLFIHHSRKDDGDDRKMARGSTAIYADCDWAYKFVDVEETKSFRRMHMVNIKPCMGPKPAPVHLELSDAAGLKWFDEGEAPRAAAADATPEAIQRAILLALASGPVENKDKLAKQIGSRRDKVSAEVDVLLVREEIVFLRGLGYALESEERQDARIVQAVAGYAHWTSEAAIAKAAQTDTEKVKRLIRKGSLTRSAEGRFIVTPRVENGV